MHTTRSLTKRCVTTAQLLAGELAPIGRVTIERRLAGIALLEDGVMFGYVDADGMAYLRTTVSSAERLHDLGSWKHPEMPYWAIPHAIATTPEALLEFAYEAADIAHLAFSFCVDGEPDVLPLPGSIVVRSFTGGAMVVAA